MSIAPYVVIGGGAAGLCASIQLAKLGQQVVLLEKNTFALPRMCGEFLSPECIPILDDWGIKPTCKITEINFYHANGKKINMNLTPAAGTMARNKLEGELFNQAKKLGVDLRENKDVTNISQHRSGNIELQLKDQNSIQANRVIVSAGRYYKQTNKPKFIYKGLKAHFRGNDIPNCLEMYISAGAYFGILPINENTVNVALLMRAQQPLPIAFKKRLAHWEQADEWIEGLVPKFGFKPSLDIPQVYMVGDAAASIPPMTGDGVGMAITSGVMVAHAAHDGNWEDYQRMWRKTFAPRIAWGKRLHHLALSPTLASGLMSVVGCMPKLGSFLYSRTRG